MEWIMFQVEQSQNKNNTINDSTKQAQQATNEGVIHDNISKEWLHTTRVVILKG